MADEYFGQGIRRGRAFWIDVIAELEREPCVHTEFMERHGLPLSAFRSWLYRLRPEGTSMDGAPEELEFEEEAVDVKARVG